MKPSELVFLTVIFTLLSFIDSQVNLFLIDFFVTCVLEIRKRLIPYLAHT